LNTNYCAEWFDPDYAFDLAQNVIAPLAKHYFRLQQVGLENIPTPYSGRPIIYAANHAGRSFPWDGILLDYAISTFYHDQHGIKVEDKPRTLVAPQVSEFKRNFPYRLENWWYRVGCVDAKAKNFMDLLRQGKDVIIFPEGVPGIERDFKDRYQLVQFQTSVLRLAIRFNALIVPVTIVGSEYFHPYARKVDWLDEVAKKFKFPFLHLSPLTVMLPFMPFLYYTVLPAKVTINFGQPLEPTALINEGEGWETGVDKLRQHVQKLLNKDRARYEKGYEFKKLIASLRESEEPFWKLLPTYWPHRFIKHARESFPDRFEAYPNPWWFYLPIAGLTDPKILYPAIKIPIRKSLQPQPVLASE
jgi:1-acyl-sn-glycerol-3-phosphate acyltransferase